ncbi:MAG TPA: acetate kinase [Gammaproteobacteria bacterium]|nr:acetate kinase [Gammaproteobacteria bacterium]
MKVLVLNSGSSSIKYQLFALPAGEVLVSGMVERIGEAQGAHRYRCGDSGEQIENDRFGDHRAALERILETLGASGAVREAGELYAIGHRVVHGGERFRLPVRIDQTVLEQIRDMIPLAPLHNPANLLGIEVSMQAAPGVPQVAVFDTAFHHSIPPHAGHYALPRRLYREERVRRYGFHGTSHGYVTRQAAAFLGRAPDSLRIISLHLGNGASACAVLGGRSIDTSMGMTPLEGLVMGTRCGDIDPAIPFYLAREKQLSLEQIDALLNRESGLRGLCGSNDMREVLQLAADGNEDARLALDLYCYRIKKYIGAYFAVLGGLDALVFTAGIGEHAAAIRSRVCEDLEALGIRLDPARNEAPGGDIRAIQADDARVAILVVPTDEELEIALQTLSCLQGGADFNAPG